MKSGVVYASHSGNTRQIAEAMADVLRTYGPVELISVDEARRTPADCDLLLVGAPTEGHGVPKDMRAFLELVTAADVAGVAAAAFDTRVAWPKIVSGSAASKIEAHLRDAGAKIVAPAESFIVTTEPELKPGEIEKATAWALQLVEIVTPTPSEVPV
jgi:flavodoxin